MKLHLGCGKQYLDGYVNVDVSPKVKTDLRVDLDKFPWPWSDNIFEEIKCYHVLEHLNHYLLSIEEMYRISKPNAIWYIGVPYISSSKYNAVNLYHKNHFNEYSFDFFDAEKLKGSANEINDINLRVLDIKFTYFPQWEDKHINDKAFARTHYWNVVQKIDFILKVVKM